MDPAPRTLPHLSYRELTNPLLRQALYLNHNEDYYWSEDFSPEFYAAQARAGFIAITERYHGRELLLCELQRSYALLDFDDLHISRNVRRILRKEPVSLHVGLDLLPVFKHIQAYHPRSWLTPRYLHTLQSLNPRQNHPHPIAVTLRHNGTIRAGEIGYILGSTYTSLTGFSSRDPRFRGYGTTQIVLLAQWLKRYRFAFFNLGQPYMPYKFDLGAREYSRADFLKRWHQAVIQPLPGTPGIHP